MDSLTPPFSTVTATKSSDTGVDTATFDSPTRDASVAMPQQMPAPVSSPAPSLSFSEESYDIGAIYREVAEIRRAQSQMLSTIERPTPLRLRLAMGQVAGSVQHAEKALTGAPHANLPTATTELAFKKADRMSTFYTQSAIETHAQSINPPAVQVLSPETTTLSVESMHAQAADASLQVSQSTSETTQSSALDRARQAYNDTQP